MPHLVHELEQTLEDISQFTGTPSEEFEETLNAEADELGEMIALLKAPNVKGEQGITIGKWHYFLSEV
jgi:hypothetical protein